jgi:hypothetical protein
LLGLVGLLWFLFCTATARLVYFNPDQFRAFAAKEGATWTDREILIGVACYFTVGLAGLVLVITRLIGPLFYRRVRIDYAQASPLMVFEVVPRYEDFLTLSQATIAKRTWTRLGITLLAGVIIFVMLEHPSMRHEGVSFGIALSIFGGIVLAEILMMLVKSYWSRSTFWLTARWKVNGRLREPRRYHLFEDGVIVQGLTFYRTVPWYEVQHAHLTGNTIGFIGRGELMVIPGEALVSQSSADQLMDLLLRKKLLEQRKLI